MRFFDSIILLLSFLKSKPETRRICGGMKPTIFDTFSNRNANENILFELFVQKFVFDKNSRI